MDVINLEELLKPNSTFSRKDRMQLALWLSCSILQFYHTGWIDNAVRQLSCSTLSTYSDIRSHSNPRAEHVQTPNLTNKFP